MTPADDITRISAALVDYRGEISRPRLVLAAPPSAETRVSVVAVLIINVVSITRMSSATNKRPRPSDCWSLDPIMARL